jgi:site-specific DNA recombinase
MTDNKPKSGIFYGRVSDPKQVDGTSLDSQVQHAHTFCRERRIELREIFQDKGESAKTADRTDFLRALEYCRRHRGQLDYFIVYKVDRFARNTADHFEVRKRLASWGITLLSITEPIGESPSERLVEAVLAASAEFDNEIRRVRCIDGMSARIRDGIWPFSPPPGYASQHNLRRGQKKTAPDPKHPEIFPLTQRALKEYGTGMHTQSDIMGLLDQWGLAAIRGTPTTTQFVDRILGRYLEFYAGWLRDPWNGKLFRGRHEAMITDEEMYRIRAVRLGKGRATPPKRRNELFPLRGMVRCTECGVNLTGSLSRGRGGRYAYYHCRNSACPVYGKGTRKEVLERAFLEHLRDITPKPEVLSVLRTEAEKLWQEHGWAVETRREAINALLVQLQERRDRIFAAFESGAYDEQEFRKRKGDVDGEIALSKYDLGRLGDTEAVDFPALLNFATDLVSSLPRTFSTFRVEQFARFQQILLPDGISYERNRGVGTTKLGLIYEANRASQKSNSHVVSLLRANWNRLLEDLRAIFEVMKSTAPFSGASLHCRDEGAGGANQ